MDIIDRQIISFLRKDARTPLLEIARRMDLSEGAIRKRVNAMVEKKEIKKFTIETADSGVKSVTLLKLDPHLDAGDVVKTILKIKEVEKVFEVAGKFDAIAVSNANDPRELNKVLDKIRLTKGVMETESFTVLKTNP